MLKIIIFLALLLSAKTEISSDVDYSFDTDFYKKFDSKKCDGRSLWPLVKYDTLNIETPYLGGDKGIQATRKSCASSFPIVFSGGILEIEIYIRANSRKFGIIIEIFDEHDTSVFRNIYGPSSANFRQGWHKLHLQINKDTKGYLQFRGTSLNNEIIIIDSFRYKPNTNTRNFSRIKRSINYDDQIENTYDKKHNNDLEERTKYENSRKNNEVSTGEEKIESNGVSGFDEILDNRTEPPNETTDKPQQKTISFWIPLIAVLCTFAISALITGVSAYNCGKMRVTDPPPVYIDDFEPARTMTIPRVTGIARNI